MYMELNRLISGRGELHAAEQSSMYESVRHSVAIARWKLLERC